MTKGGRIRIARELAGMTQTELGLKIGVIQQTVYQWECNRRNAKAENLKKIADATGAKFSWLLGIED